MARVLVIGLDAATPILIDRWIDELKNINRLRQSGVSGILRSTTPPVSCPAWNSFMTGKNPGKLGIYDFQVQQFDVQKGSRIVDSTSQDSITLWEILSHYGKQVVVLNVPATFPPVEVNGLMVSGFLTPLGRKDYTYPRELARELDSICKPYYVDYDVTLPQYHRDGYSGFLEECLRLFHQKLKITKHLIKKTDWDFFITVFMILDRVQHYFWHLSDPSSPLHGKDDLGKDHDVVKECYKKIDTALGEILNLIDDETYVLVMSDHGFGPHYGRFFINNWLEEEGFLSWSRTLTNQMKFLLSNKILNDTVVKAVVDCGLADILIKERLNQKREWVKRLLSIHMPGDFLRKSRAYLGIEWEKTKAYGLGYGKLYINLNGRESKGIVNQGEEYDILRNQIINRLLKVKDPLTSLPVVDRVYLKEEIYSGKHLHEAPDLVFVMRDWSYNQAVGNSDKGLWQIPFYKTGDHREEGIWILTGPDIMPLKKREANIVDLAPTILNLLGTPIPRDMDGRVLSDIFELCRNPTYADAIKKTPEEYEYSKTEEEELRERLRKLGYLD